MTQEASTVDSATRERVVEAVLACILEKGFYRASSNEIARQAGVTWGVIQHHFGSRENLMVAAMEHSCGQLEQLIAAADVGGDTTARRLAKYLRVLTDFYGRPEFLAFLQIQLNLERDPSTSERTRELLDEAHQRIQKGVLAAQRQVLGEDDESAGESPLAGTIFHACRGMAISQRILATTQPDRYPSQDEEQEGLLVEALAMLVEARHG